MTQRLCRHCILGGQLHSSQHRERNIDDLLRADDMLLYYDNNDNLEGSGIKKGLFTKQLIEYNKKHNSNLSMREFANLVMNDNSFKKSTKNRAVFYLNVSKNKTI
jgi:hypothetical protein